MKTLSNLDFEMVIKNLVPKLGDAFVLVIKITLLSFALAMIIGLLIALGRLCKSKIVNGILVFLLEIIRGTPLLVQLVYMYYVIPLVIEAIAGTIGIKFEINMTAMFAGIIGLGLNYGCLLSEVIRSAILSIDSGQKEAALALGFSNFEALFQIIIPQAMKNSIPVFGNYLSTIVKDTSLLAYIAVPELLLITKNYSSQTLRTIESYSILAIAYLVITIPLTRVVKLIEIQLNKIGSR